MVEKRANTRVTPPEGSTVINQVNATKMGRIVDLSASGFLLAGRVKINSGMIFQLVLALSENKDAHIKVGAECIWSDLQTSGLTFAGFQIIDIAAEDYERLSKIIEQLTAN